MISPESPTVTYTTYRNFCGQVLRVAFPDRVGHTQKAAFDNFVAAALIKAQRYVQCLRANQGGFYYHEQMSVQCGLAQFQGPRGKINAVYAFRAGEDECAKFFYTPSTPQKITCWSQESGCNWTTPDTTQYQSAVDLCYPYTSTDTEEEDECWKCEPKFFARGQAGELWLAPRPPCGYIVAVHWEGIRRRWSSSDLIPEDQDLIDWVAEYVKAEMTTRIDKDPGLGRILADGADKKFADLIWWCNEERMAQFSLDCASGIDTGNLTSMWPSLYPYPYEEL